MSAHQSIKECAVSPTSSDTDNIPVAAETPTERAAAAPSDAAACASEREAERSTANSDGAASKEKLPTLSEPNAESDFGREDGRSPMSSPAREVISLEDTVLHAAEKEDNEDSTLSSPARSPRTASPRRRSGLARDASSSSERSVRPHTTDATDTHSSIINEDDDVGIDDNDGSPANGEDAAAEDDEQAAALLASSLLVSNLSRNVTEEHLKEIAGIFGSVVKVTLSAERQRFSRGEGTIAFATRADAENAKSYLTGGQLDGQRIRAEFVHPRGGYSRGPQNYRRPLLMTAAGGEPQKRDVGNRPPPRGAGVRGRSADMYLPRRRYALSRSPRRPPPRMAHSDPPWRPRDGHQQGLSHTNGRPESDRFGTDRTTAPTHVSHKVFTADTAMGVDRRGDAGKRRRSVERRRGSSLPSSSRSPQRDRRGRMPSRRRTSQAEGRSRTRSPLVSSSAKRRRVAAGHSGLRDSEDLGTGPSPTSPLQGKLDQFGRLRRGRSPAQGHGNRKGSPSMHRSRSAASRSGDSLEREDKTARRSGRGKAEEDEEVARPALRTLGNIGRRKQHPLFFKSRRDSAGERADGDDFAAEKDVKRRPRRRRSRSGSSWSSSLSTSSRELRKKPSGTAVKRGVGDSHRRRGRRSLSSSSSLRTSTSPSRSPVSIRK